MKYDKRPFPFVYKLLISIILFLIIFLAAMALGAVNTTLYDVWLSIFSKGNRDSLLMLREIRLPRAIAAILVGASLAVSGAIMQGMTRNPLADPGLLGLSSDANLALAITIALFPETHYLYIVIVCFAGALLGMLMVLSISAINKRGFSPFRIVLAGAAVTAFLTAITEGIGIYFLSV